MSALAMAVWRHPETGTRTLRTGDNTAVCIGVGRPAYDGPLVWHYSTGNALTAVIASGELRPSKPDTIESPLLWWTRNQSWDYAATRVFSDDCGRAYTLPFVQAADRAGYLRYGIPAHDGRLLNWPEARAAAGMPRQRWRRNEREGIKNGATPADWCAMREAVPLDELTLEIWYDEAWTPVGPDGVLRSPTSRN